MAKKRGGAELVAVDKGELQAVADFLDSLQEQMVGTLAGVAAVRHQLGVFMGDGDLSLFAPGAKPSGKRR